MTPIETYYLSCEEATAVVQRARLDVAGHLSTILIWENLVACLSQSHNKGTDRQTSFCLLSEEIALPATKSITIIVGLYRC